MEKYFTKYLPVEGEIKEGDHVIDTKTNIGLNYIEGDRFVNPNRKGIILPDWKERFQFQKQKLFLCSGNIILNDTYYNESFCPYPNGEKAKTNTEVIDANLMAGGPNDENRSYKIIGEVSPDAIWVTEGQELNEDDVRYEGIHSKFRDQDFTAWNYEDYWDYIKGKEERYTLICKIKCPTCGTFH